MPKRKRRDPGQFGQLSFKVEGEFGLAFSALNALTGLRGVDTLKLLISSEMQKIVEAGVALGILNHEEYAGALARHAEHGNRGQWHVLAQMLMRMRVRCPDFPLRLARGELSPQSRFVPAADCEIENVGETSPVKMKIGVGYQSDYAPEHGESEAQSEPVEQHVND